MIKRAYNSTFGGNLLFTPIRNLFLEKYFYSGEVEAGLRLHAPFRCIFCEQKIACLNIFDFALEVWKKRSEKTQTLRVGCSKAEPKIFAPPQTPFPGGAGRPKFNQLETVTIPLPTNPVWWRSMHAISSYHGNRPTHTQTHTHTHTHPPIRKQTGPITIHCAAAIAQCIIML